MLIKLEGGVAAGKMMVVENGTTGMKIPYWPPNEKNEFPCEIYRWSGRVEDGVQIWTPCLKG